MTTMTGTKRTMDGSIGNITWDNGTETGTKRTMGGTMQSNGNKGWNNGEQ